MTRIEQAAREIKCEECGAQVFTKCFLTTVASVGLRTEATHESRINEWVRQSVAAEIRKIEAER